MLDALLAKQISFASPGMRHTRVLPEGHRRFVGVSTMVASFIVQLDESSSRNFSQTIAERCNAFLKEESERLMQLDAGTVVARNEGLTLYFPAGEFSVKLFVCATRLADQIDLHGYVVHPEEMDVVLRCAYGEQYDAYFAPRD